MSQKVSRRSITSAVVDRLLDGSSDPVDVMQALAAYLVDHSLADQADVLMNEIAEELYARTGRLTVEVTSARKLSGEARENLLSYLKQITNAKTVDLHEEIDTDLVGGLVARTASAELDVSVRNKLRQLTAIA